MKPAKTWNSCYEFVTSSGYSRCGDTCGTWPSSAACSNSLLIVSVEKKQNFFPPAAAAAAAILPSNHDTREAFPDRKWTRTYPAAGHLLISDQLVAAASRQGRHLSHLALPHRPPPHCVADRDNEQQQKKSVK